MIDRYPWAEQDDMKPGLPICLALVIGALAIIGGLLWIWSH